MGDEVVVTIKSVAQTAAGFKQATDDSEKFGKNVEKSSQRAELSLKSMKGPALAAGGAIIGLGIAAGKAASDAQQSLGATQQIFGKTADIVVARSNQAATAYGLSADAYRNSANLIGSLLVNQGTSQDKLAGATDALVQKGADLSAVFGGPASDAIDAMGAALKGEFDPLQRYGITLTQAAINAQALTEAHVSSVQQFNKLTTAQQQAAKSAATVALINKQSASSTGQFAAQSGTAAEQAQIAGAKYKNLASSLGTQLLPIFSKVVDIATKFSAWASQNQTLVKVLAIVFLGLAAAVWLLNIAMYANPVVLIGIAIIALIAILVVLWLKFKIVRDIAALVGDYFVFVAHSMIGAWNALWAASIAVAAWFAGPFVNFWVRLYHILVDPFVAFYSFMFAVWGKVIGDIRSIPGRINAAASGMWDGIKNAFRSMINWIIDKWNNLHFTIPGVDTHIPGVGTVGGFTLNTPDIPRLARGGRAISGGQAIVGENGAEVVDLAAGDTVHPHGTGNGGGVFEVRFSGNTDSAFAAAFMLLIRTGQITINPQAVR